MTVISCVVTPQGLASLKQLHYEAVESVTTRFHQVHAAEYVQLGEQSRKFCRENTELLLDSFCFALELGDIQPYIEHLRWFEEVLRARHISTDHVTETRQLLGEFFFERMDDADGATIATALTATESGPSANPGSPTTSHIEKWPDQDRFEEALLTGNRRKAVEIVSHLAQQGRSQVEIDVFLIQAALVSIGLKWQSNQISIAQEHLATATAQTVMADSFSKSSLPPLNGKKVLLACIEGNNHSVGLRMVSDAFELEGWDVQYLGADAPTHALVEQIMAWKPHMVGLSISLPNQLDGTRKVIDSLRTRLADNCPPIMIGGAAVNLFPELVQHIGADGHASDALAALRHPIRV
jgi:methanogenic corrinoid protein MtbC1